MSYVSQILWTSKVLDEGTKMIACSCWLLGYAAALSVNDPLHLYFGKSFCSILDFVSGIGVFQNCLGGVGIALMRVLYIQFSSRVPIKENTLAVLIGTITSGIILGLSCIWYMVHTPTFPDFEPICLGRPLDDPLVDYNSPTYKLKSLNIEKFRLVCVGTALAFTSLLCLEMAMYASIYTFLIKHDKMMMLVLSDTTIKKRMRKNTIDLFGHSMIFLADVSWLLIKGFEIWLSKDSNSILRNRRWIFKGVNMSVYGITSIMHIMVSSTLRSNAITIIRKFSWPFIMIWTAFQEFKHRRTSITPELLPWYVYCSHDYH